MKAPSSKAAGPVVEWNYVFLLFWSQLVISEKQRFPLYTTFTLHFSHSIFFFIHSILTRLSEEGLSVTDRFSFIFFFLGKNKNKTFFDL